MLTVFDARAKLFFILLLTTAIFLVNKLILASCMLLCFIIIRLVTGVPFYGLKILKNLTLLAAFIILMQMIFGPGEVFIGFLKWEGLILGLVIVCRLFSLFALLPMLTETTPLSGIACGLCAMGLNYRLSFIITTAFNLIPVFREEALAIQDAQRLRGMRLPDRRTGVRRFIKQRTGESRFVVCRSKERLTGAFRSGIHSSVERHSVKRRPGASPVYRLAAYTGLIVPLMLGAMRKAQYSSIAMDCRAFGAYKTRTWLLKPRMKGRDFTLIAGSIFFFACVILFNYK